MKRVLVTGASGFVGGQLVEYLLDCGNAVRAVYRRKLVPTYLERQKNRSVELVRRDLAGADDLADLVRGCSHVVHAAAKVADYGPRDEFRAINVRATENLISAAVDTGCERFLFVGSIAVHGFGNHLGSVEEGPYYPLRSSYQKSKLDAENVVREYGSRLPITILRPGLVYGPGDTTTLGPLFELLASGKLPMLRGFDHGNCPIYIDDLVAAIEKALICDDARGEVFNIVSGEKVSLREAIEFAAKRFDRSLPSYNVPMWAARTLASAAEFASFVTGYRFRPPLTRYLASQLSHDFYFSPEKARRVLGFNPRVSWQDGIAASVDAFRERVDSP